MDFEDIPAAEVEDVESNGDYYGSISALPEPEIDDALR